MVGDKLLGKLWDTVTKGGIGSLASPWQTRRQGRANVDARRDELLVLAQTEVDVAEIKAGKKKLTADRKLISLVQPDTDTPLVELKSGKIEPYFSLDELHKNAEARIEAQHIQEQVNLTKAVLFAEEELENNFTEASDDEVDADWFVRWRDCAEKVSNEDLQRLWAKALAGEVASPGTYSLRTLEFIKNISQAEAREISKLAPYVIDGLVYKAPCLESNGLNFAYLLEMDDLGILSGVKGGGLKVTLSSRIRDKFEQMLLHNSQVLLIKHEMNNKKVSFECYKVTKLGCEVLRLGVFPMMGQYLEEVGTKAKQQGFEVVIADWVQTTKEYGNFYNPKTL